MIASCGTCRNLTKVGGVIESVNFPDEYESNLNCLFTINGPPDSKIQLNFTEFVVENCCDFITVSVANRDQVPKTGVDK